MVSLILLVFTIQLAIHIINSVGAKTINDLIWQLAANLSLLPASAQAQKQAKLRRDVVRLKQEMSAISAQDDFARWAKIRREHDKLMAEHDKTASAVASARSSFDTKASAIRWTLTSGLRFGLQFWHGKTPMFALPGGWFPWYVEWILAFPRCPYGGVSINVWSMVCATVVSLVGDSVTTALQTGHGQGQTTGTASRAKAEVVK